MKIIELLKKILGIEPKKERYLRKIDEINELIQKGEKNKALEMLKEYIEKEIELEHGGEIEVYEEDIQFGGAENFFPTIFSDFEDVLKLFIKLASHKNISNLVDKIIEEKGHNYYVLIGKILIQENNKEEAIKLAKKAAEKGWYNLAASLMARFGEKSLAKKYLKKLSESGCGDKTIKEITNLLEKK